MLPKLCGLMVLLTALAAAQNQQNGVPDAVLAGLPSGAQVVFYSGDFNPRNILANGLLNQNVQGTDGTVWVPFAVQKLVTVNYLFIHELFTAPPPTTAPAQWAISNGVSQGNGGKIQCAGSGTANSVATGRSVVYKSVKYVEYRYVIKVSPECQLTSTVEPEQDSMASPRTKGGCPGGCSMSVSVSTGPRDGAGLQGFLSDVEDDPPRHHIGLPNINDSSFFSSTAFGFNFQPTAATQDGVCALGPPLSITQAGCDMFSVGIAGSGQ